MCCRKSVACVASNLTCALRLPGRSHGHEDVPPSRHRPGPHRGGTMTTTPFVSAAAVQKQMWVVDRIDPGASIYNEDIAFWIDGDLRVDVLEAAWRILAERHEVLRYVFDVQNADLRLRVVPEPELSFVTVDCATEPEALAWG